MSTVISCILLLGLGVIILIEVKSLITALKERKRVKKEGGKVDDEVEEEENTSK